MTTGYWKQVRWDEYRLMVGTDLFTFRDYVSLWIYCNAHNIDAKQS